MLESNYFVTSKRVSPHDILSEGDKERTLFFISNTKHTKRVKTLKLIGMLKELGYKNISSKHPYTQFTLKSPIKLTKIKHYLKERYREIYPDIQIEKISVAPRSFRRSLPKHYIVKLNKKFYLKRDGTLYIKTEENKKIFFDYKIRAKLKVLSTKEELKRGDELSNLNIKKSTITLNKFRAMPLLKLKKSSYEAKRKLKRDTILTVRDVMGLKLIKRGESISITLKDKNIDISFIGKADRGGRYGETIRITTASGKKVNAIVTGRKRAEIE